MKYGYSDGKDVGGEKWIGRWVTYGKILSTGKPYTSTVPSLTTYNAGDLGGKRLTDGIVASPYPGGNNYAYGVSWPGKTEPTVTVDLGQVEKCGAFRIQLGSYQWDAMMGTVPDKVEVLTSSDGQTFASQGYFNFNLRWKDLPVNYFWPDDESFGSPNFEMVLPRPVEARYVRFKVTTPRGVSCSEVQVHSLKKATIGFPRPSFVVPAFAMILCTSMQSIFPPIVKIYRPLFYPTEEFS